MTQFTRGNQPRVLTSASKRIAKRVAFLGASLILVNSAKSFEFQSSCQAGETKANRNVEIHSDQVELVDVQAGASAVLTRKSHDHPLEGE